MPEDGKIPTANERQSGVTKKQIQSLSKALRAAAHEKADMAPQLFDAMVVGIRSQIRELREEVRKCERQRQ